MKNKRISLIILLMFLIIIAMMPIVHADFNANTYKPDPLTGGQVIINTGNRIVGVIQVVGIVVSVAVLIALGIKYVVGSVEEKATYKKSMMPYLIGAIMLFSASAVAQLLYDIGMELTNS